LPNCFRSNGRPLKFVVIGVNQVAVPVRKWFTRRDEFHNDVPFQRITLMSETAIA
jgi:hypothetical protein